MTNLLLRFFDAQKGDIKIDDISIYDVTQNSLRDNIGLVFFFFSLFNSTILDNIRLDVTGVTKADIERVAEKSHATDFIQNLTDGFDTVVGER